MEFSEKQKYNGFAGFVSGTLFSDSNAFMDENKARLQRRSEREKERKQNENIK